jgi:hypothetical protein
MYTFRDQIKISLFSSIITRVFFQYEVSASGHYRFPFIYALLGTLTLIVFYFFFVSISINAQKKRRVKKSRWQTNRIEKVERIKDVTILFFTSQKTREKASYTIEEEQMKDVMLMPRGMYCTHKHECD